MRPILITLLTIFCLTTCPAPVHAEFTQADRERIIQLLTKVEEMDKRFDQVDKRIDDLRMDLNKRIDDLRTDTNNRFEQVDNRFEQVDKRFVELREDMNARFEQVNNQFAQVNNQFETITNLLMAIVGAFAAIVVMTIGFAYWDRRTMLRPLEAEVIRIRKTVSDKVEVQIQEIATKVENLETQVARTAEAEIGKRRRIQDALAEMGSKGGEDARLAAIFRGLL